MQESNAATESYAHQLDQADPLASYRERFLFPRDANGQPRIYLAGNSLGLQPVSVRAAIERELDDWARLAVDAHFDGRTPWYSYHETLRESSARLVGALPHEVVMMNSLTVNLHLMMVSFYRPTPSRYKILIESPAFPSDGYAVRTQLQHHGIDPAYGLIELGPRAGAETISLEDYESVLDEQGDSIALVLWGGVNYYTGQVFDIGEMARLARARGCIFAADLAHAVGNVPLRMHDWDVDFAAWCTYKYLNSGPGAVAGCFVHERHARNTSLVRFGGWWGNDPSTRFRMHLEPQFKPQPSADGWQLSNPPIMALAPVRASMAIFDEVGIDALRAKSVRLTGYLRQLLSPLASCGVRILTPANEKACGCQLSIMLSGQSDAVFTALSRGGVTCDMRKPDVIRVAPVPLYNSFHDVWRFADILARSVGGSLNQIADKG